MDFDAVLRPKSRSKVSKVLEKEWAGLGSDPGWSNTKKVVSPIGTLLDPRWGQRRAYCHHHTDGGKRRSGLGSGQTCRIKLRLGSAQPVERKPAAIPAVRERGRPLAIVVGRIWIFGLESSPSPLKRGTSLGSNPQNIWADKLRKVHPNGPLVPECPTSQGQRTHSSQKSLVEGYVASWPKQAQLCQRYLEALFEFIIIPIWL